MKSRRGSRICSSPSVPNSGEGDVFCRGDYWTPTTGHCGPPARNEICAEATAKDCGDCCAQHEQKNRRSYIGEVQCRCSADSRGGRRILARAADRPTTRRESHSPSKGEEKGRFGGEYGRMRDGEILDARMRGYLIVHETVRDSGPYREKDDLHGLPPTERSFQSARREYPVQLALLRKF